jgi:N,N'-diacetyllegionaminate synthase
MKLIENKKFFLIAEVGNNHEGSINNAIKLVKEAKKSGADAVKFQTYLIEDYIHKKQKERYERLKKFQLTFTQFFKLKELSHKLGLKFISTPLDLKSAKFISKISDAVKIASGDNDNNSLLEESLKNCKNLIISTGFADLKLTNKIFNKVKYTKGKLFVKKKFALLHCTSSYPSKITEINLKALDIMKKKFNCEIGLSDHTKDYKSCIYAAFMGVRLFEKHFTLDNNFSNFIDHKVSLNPKNFRLLKDKIEETQLILGNGIKKIQNCEKKFFNNSKRSLIAKKLIKKGKKLSIRDFKLLRPRYDDSIDINTNLQGQILLKDIYKDQHLTYKYLKK